MSFADVAGTGGVGGGRGAGGISPRFGTATTPPLPLTAAAAGTTTATAAETEEGRSLARLQEGVSGLARLVSSIDEAVRSIGTPRDNHELRARVHHDVEDAQSRMKDLAAFVKRVSSGPAEATPQMRQRRQRLVEDFVKTCAEFKKVSILAAEREHTPIPESALRRMQQQQQQRAALTEEQERQSLLEAARREQIAQIEAEREYVDGINLEREEEVRQLEANVVQVNEMFRDLASIVQQQGVMIETIDSNVSTAVQQTDAGLGEVQKASTYERKTRGKICCLLLLAVIGLGVVVCVIVLPIVLRKKH